VVYESVSMLEVVVWGVKMFNVEITKKAIPIIKSKMKVWINHLIHLVLHVM
jgi:hypothetical protein